MTGLTGDKIQLFRSMLQSAARIGIVSHVHPDGDAVGSSFALAHFIKDAFAKDALVILPGEIPETLVFVSGGFPFILADKSEDAAAQAVASCDLIVCLDFNAFNRTGPVLPDMLKTSSARKVLIDHHLNPDESCFDLVFSCINVSSTCELLYAVLKRMPDCFGISSATALMTGMTTDSNNFANSVFPSTLEMASDLLSMGVDRDGILMHIYDSYGENRLRAMGAFLSDAMQVCDNGVAYAILDKAFLDRFDVREGDTEGFVNMPLAVGKVGMSILLKEDKGHFRISIRSKRGISAASVAKLYFHGGGHECAAGGKLFFPEDIPDSSAAGEFMKDIAARLM